MNKPIIIGFIIFTCFIQASYAASFWKCRQSDGTVIYTNKTCSSIARPSSNVFNKSKNRKVPPFRQANFVRLQNSMINASSAKKMEQRAQIIIDKALTLAQKGRINNAYDMVAASYAKLSKQLKDKRWKDQPIEGYALKMQSLFEEVLISQSTTTKPVELELIVQTAWENYHKTTAQTS